MAIFNHPALRLALAAGLSASAVPALSYEPGQIIVRAGYASVQPHDDSDTLSLSSSFAAPLNAGDLAGTGVGVDDAQALGITASYLLNSHWAVELLAATPFEHDISANLNGLGLGNVKAGSAKQLPPTLSLQWFPMAADSVFQPYLGLGLNYTTFFSEDVDPALDTAVGSAAGLLLGTAPVALTGTMSLKDSWGLAAEAGFDYALNQHWLLNASLWYIDIETEATLDFYAGTTKAATVKTDVEINPWAYMLSLGYSF